jgi:prepilin-type N-terminal cleavage/methylation domain-containing protein
MKTPGFSLIELSIVLVILGLLAGGILAGQSLIRAAELRAVTTEYQRYTTAANSFRDKYFGMPGDFRDGTRFWGYQGGTGCTSNAGISTTSTTGTCDGNGDGFVNNASAASQTGETFQFWRQLAAAGLIEGTYTGLSGSVSTMDPVFGENSPRSKAGSAVGWGSNYLDNRAGATSNLFLLDYRNSLTIGGDDGSWADTPSFKAEEVWNIDMKMDDGKPAQGKIHAYPSGNSCNNATSNADFAGDYALTTTTQNACAIIFRQ